MAAGLPRRCAVLGHPVAHSLSPVLHRTAYDELGLDWSYESVDVEESGLRSFVEELGPPWRGLSLTMPLKRAVLPLLDEWAADVSRSGVANTLVLDGGRRTGHNTDIPGAVAALGERSPGIPETATVLGGGATAASLVLALRDVGVSRIVVAARNVDRARDSMPSALADTLEYAQFAEAPVGDVVASTVPSAAVSGALLERLSTAPVVFDVIYDPWPTALASAAGASGAVVVSGLDLLVHQAVLQVELFTGRSGDGLVSSMRAAGERELGSRRG